MDIAMLVITLISTVATVISCIIAVKAKNESKKILNKVQNINIGTQSLKSDSAKNKGNIGINNSGDNEGIMAGVVNGGINNHGKK